MRYTVLQAADDQEVLSVLRVVKVAIFTESGTQRCLHGQAFD